jgi:hypothetical protein
MIDGGHQVENNFVKKIAERWVFDFISSNFLVSV